MKVIKEFLQWMRRVWTRVLICFYTEMAFSDMIAINKDVTVTQDYRDPSFELKLRREGYVLPGEPVCCHHPELQRHKTWLTKLMTRRFNFQHTMKVSIGEKEILIGHGQKSFLLSTFDGVARFSDDSSWLRKLLYKVTVEDQAGELFRDVVWGPHEAEAHETEIGETDSEEIFETEVVGISEEAVMESGGSGGETQEKTGMDIDFSLFR